MSSNYEIHVFQMRDGRWGARSESSRFGAYTLHHTGIEEAATTAIYMVFYGKRLLPVLSKSEAARTGGLYRVREEHSGEGSQTPTKVMSGDLLEAIEVAEGIAWFSEAEAGDLQRDNPDSLTKHQEAKDLLRGAAAIRRLIQEVGRVE